MGKVHKIPLQEHEEALRFHSQNGFWNPAMTTVTTFCGIDPSRATGVWNRVTCKRCLAKRPKEKKL